MDVENTFSVGAPPDRVYAYLLDINRVVGCVPGAQLSEVVDEQTFRGKVKIKVGPVTVSYDGVARIANHDEAARAATVEAEGREVGGSGSARATTRMQVTPAGDGSEVRFTTEFSVVGRAAQFGRGIMQDVSKRLVAQMGTCIAKRLEAEGAGTDPSSSASTPASGTSTASAPAESGVEPPSPAAPATLPLEPSVGAEEPAALDALALARGVAADRLRRVGPARLAAAAGAVALLVLGLLWRRRR